MSLNNTNCRQWLTLYQCALAWKSWPVLGHNFDIKFYPTYSGSLYHLLNRINQNCKWALKCLSNCQPNWMFYTLQKGLNLNRQSYNPVNLNVPCIIYQFIGRTNLWLGRKLRRICIVRSIMPILTLIRHFIKFRMCKIFQPIKTSTGQQR